MISIISWNVDGYDDMIHQYLKEDLNKNKYDVVFLSETKCEEIQLEKYFSELSEYNYIINTHVPIEYHGVAFLIRKDHSFKNVKVRFKAIPRRDNRSGDPQRGRLIVITLNEKVNIVGTYVPNSGIKGLRNLYYRTNIWDPALFSLLNQLKDELPTIWVGDINVAIDEIDVSHPKKMIKYPGFTPQERNNISQFLENGWIDVWRHFHPDVRKYSWVGYSKQKNYGMRLDNIIISPGDFIHSVHSSFILEDVTFSDHLPIGIKFKLPNDNTL